MSKAVPMLEIPNERLRGVGILSANRGEKKAILPLAGVRIDAQVADRVSTVTMEETFQNPYPEHLETVYIFPLPGGAAVSSFEMRVGNRVVVGKVEERGEARKQYQEAIDQGKRAALMEKERDDVFTVQVGNIPPGEEITIKIAYSERLPFFDDGATELRLPLVVAPRYIPGQALERNPVGDGIEQDTNLVPDASRITPPRLAEGFDPKVALSINVTVLWDQEDELGDINNLCCSQHATRTSAGREGVKVSLAHDNELLNRDFVLRWTLSGKRLRPSLLFHQDLTGKNYGMLSLIPPYNEGQNKQARDVIFVLDNSGSMQGIKMSSASRACALLLRTLGADDRFAIQVFNSSPSWFSGNHYHKDGYFLPADEAGFEQGEQYLYKVTAQGGTEMYAALTQAISGFSQRRTLTNRVPVVVMLTDGEVGNESQIIKKMQEELGSIRLFTIGIDTAVNQGFLQKLASIGNGTSTFVTPGSQLEDALINVGREIGIPLVVNLTIEDVDSGLEGESVAPNKMVDLFSGRATTTFFASQKIGRVRVKGRYPNGDRFEMVVEGRPISLPAVSQLWAKSKINDLEDRFRIAPNEQSQIKQQIIKLSVQHKILTKFTAFIAVDHEEIVNKEHMQRKVVQPVEPPAGWDMNVAAPAVPPAPVLFAAPPPPMKTPAPMVLPSAPAGAEANIPTMKKSVTPSVSRDRRKDEHRNDVNLTQAGIVVGSAGGNLNEKTDQIRSKMPSAPPLADLCMDFLMDEDDSSDKSFAVMEQERAITIGKPQTETKPKPAPQIDRTVFEWLINAVIEIYGKVLGQSTESYKALEKIRREIIDILTKARLDSYLPNSIRFFNYLAVDLVNSLKQGNAKSVFEQHKTAFEDTLKELDTYFSFSLFSKFDSVVKNVMASQIQPSGNTSATTEPQSVVETKNKDDSFWDSSI